MSTHVQADTVAPGSASERCAVCGSTVRPDVIWWASRCVACGTWKSTLQLAINEQTPEVIDHEARVSGLRELRRENFRTVLDRIEAITPLDGKRLLDVGCSDGWFLQDAAERRARSVGLEPDEAIAHRARARGAHVRIGVFPQALAPSEQFDVITFNDVLEHLPNPREALEACSAHLAPGGGLLSINIPTSDGVGYRIATALARLGIRGPYARLWQADLPSPHTYYFPRAALRQLVEQAGFVVEDEGPLTAVASTGLWHRVHVLRKPTPGSVGTYVVLRALAPVLNSPLVTDIHHVLARKR